MNFQQFPESLLIPRIIVGTSNMGSVLPDAFVSTTDQKKAFQYLDKMLSMGCFAFDIAASYQLGGTERLIGHWINSRRNRDQLFLITKGGHPYPIVQPHRLTPKAISADLHASLKRLQTESINLYLLHRDDPSEPLERILETLAGFQKQGKVKAWGVSNWTHSRIRALNTLATQASLPPITASSPHFSLAEWTRTPWKGCVSIAGEANREARSFYQDTQLPIFAWSPLGRGFFSQRTKTATDSQALRIYGSAKNSEKKKRAEKLAQKYQMTPAQIALAYLFHQPFPVFSVVATSSLENLQKNLEATTVRLSEREVSWLESGEESHFT